MRRTVTLDPDVAAEVERLRREEGPGPERGGQQAGAVRDDAPRTSGVHTSVVSAGIKVDITCMGEALSLLDEFDAQG